MIDEDVSTLREKARRNFVLAKELSTVGDPGHANSAASRLYYSVFQAIWAHLEETGVDPAQFHRDNRQGWTHDAVNQWTQDNASPTIVAKLQQLKGLRSAADYDPHVHVKKGLVFKHLTKAEGILSQFGIAVA